MFRYLTSFQLEVLKIKHKYIPSECQLSLRIKNHPLLVNSYAQKNFNGQENSA